MSDQDILGRLLVVDDDELVRDYLQTRLAEAGYACACAANGVEALQLLRRETAPEVIILDLNMPGMDGFEFLRMTRTQIGHGFGVIVMTGQRAPRLKEQATGFGAFTVIEKPVAFEELLRLIRIQQQYQKIRARLR